MDDNHSISLSQFPRCETCNHYDYSSQANGMACNKIQYGNHVNPDGVTYQDFEGYHAWHKVGPKYGCLHHSSIIKTEETE